MSLQHKISSLLIIVLTTLLVGCSTEMAESETHFITNVEYRTQVEQQFEKVKLLAQGRSTELFDVFKQQLSLQEREAMMFLYAYMPLSDLCNNNGDYYLSQVRIAFQTREQLSWGAAIPEDVFRHFVLPYRINNEDSDSSRSVFFKEIYPRVKDLSIEEAALEVNHWCHEKVNYKGTDGRTISPLGAIKTAYGRCGEESTFTVTALRSVGIPARQVYTPRWAHTDDNHAWVEVFVNNEWKYLGACEPKPKLNIGWFDAPVLRAMMVHTKAYGQYLGSEKVLGVHNQYSVLNLLSNYVPVKPIYVKIIDDNNTALEGVNIDFGLYNYAEFYPLKSIETDANGFASLTTGMGDIRIFAADKKDHFAVKLLSVITTDTIIMTLDKTIGEEYSLNLDYNPPIAKTPDTTGSDNYENKKRFKYEDELREKYISTFYTEEKALVLATKYGLDTAALTKVMINSRGNYSEIENYLEQASKLESPFTLTLLEVIAEKDLHDITADVLMDNLSNYRITYDNIYAGKSEEYILNPRIQLERLTAYKSFFQEKLEYLDAESPNETANNVIDWIKENIKIENDLNYYKITLSPIGLYDLKVSDEKSRNIFFVAVMRSLGVVSRIEQATFKPQYFDKEWVDVNFDSDNKSVVSPKAFVSFTKPASVQIEPQYWIHFGLAKFDGKRFNTLEYDWEKKWNTFDDKIAIEPGYYQMTTGNRLEDGSVLVNQTYFEIKEGESRDLSINVRADNRSLETLASYKHKEDSFVIYAWINPNSEPGTHFLKDIEPLKADFIKRNAKVKIYTDNDENISKLSPLRDYGFEISKDVNNKLLNDFYSQTGFEKGQELPVIAAVLKDGSIVYFTSGYNIGTPEQLLKLIDRIVQ